ncbi:MAG: hypothetical protein CSB32_02075 [Desulfobacterales bacterium]|nr:MAG: hypothetical protein CSB32_02075 [Desulfobacterales bacterium]
MDIAATIIPIFIIIILGWLARRKGFLPPEFLNPANRLVYYIAIPAMIFNTLSQATLSSQQSAESGDHHDDLVGGGGGLFRGGTAIQRSGGVTSPKGDLYSVRGSRKSGLYRFGGGLLFHG